MSDINPNPNPPMLAMPAPIASPPPVAAGPPEIPPLLNLEIPGPTSAALSPTVSINALNSLLQKVEQRRQNLRFWAALASCWAAAAIIGWGLIVIQGVAGPDFILRIAGFNLPFIWPLAGLVGITLVGFALIRLQHHRRGNLRQLAAQIEARYPELEGRLLTAIQQQPAPEMELGYLQHRIIQEALRHGEQNNWSDLIPQSRIVLAQLAHLLALCLFLLTSVTLGFQTSREHRSFAHGGNAEVTVTPGDTAIERGNSLIIFTRFGGPLPAVVNLVLGSSAGQTQSIPLVKSLADPVFGGSLPEVSSNLVYHVEYAGKRTRDFKVTVFDYPKLERSDAELLYPAYTGLPIKRIQDTRHISAVEGSRLDLSLQLNKPVLTARLVPKGERGDNDIPLQILTNRTVAELKQFVLAASKSYELQLVDADGRTNKVPSQFVFAALPNRAPELHLTSPRGDIRPSPLEEISFDGTAWDDFGVQSYGLGYTVAGQDPQLISLGEHVPAKEKRSFHHLLRLEDLALQPDELIAWFAWADDIGPDGQVRRTSTDLFFGEVRPFEEVFREGQGMEGGQAGQTGQAGQNGQSATAKLAELQKQIINATWKLQRAHVATNANQSSLPIRRAARLTSTSNSRVNPLFLPGYASLAAIASHHGFMGLVSPGLHAQVKEPRITPSSASARPAQPGLKPPRPGQSYEEDLKVIREALEQALEQAEAASGRQDDPRLQALWSATKTEMEKALALLDDALKTPTSLPGALAAEKSAYQALLKLQEHEYQVTRSRNQSPGGEGRQGQMQRQLDQLEFKQSDDRYETQREARTPQSTERKEELQVMNRLQELARRQQDLNDKLKELQTALQQARTDEARQELRRQLKRLQEDEQQLLADVDEVKQRMDRPENQSRMSEERQQLEQTRNDVQRAAEEAGKGSPGQALAAGTRAQRQLQEMREQMRKQNSNEFAEELRKLRGAARELERRQDAILNKLQPESVDQRKSLTDAFDRDALLKDLERQKQDLTNLVERVTQVTQETEQAEPLVSKQLYDTVRKFSQDTGKGVRDLQSQWLNRGQMPRSLYDHLKDSKAAEGTKLLEMTSEMLRQDGLPQAQESGQVARSALNSLKQGVERAAQSVIGDDAEALRLAQDELGRLTEQLQQEMAQAGNEGTNGSTAGALDREANGSKSRLPASQNVSPATGEASREQASRPGQPATQSQGESGEGKASGNEVTQATPPPSNQAADSGQAPGSTGADGQQPESASGERQARNSPSPSAPRNGRARSGEPSSAGGGGEGSDLARNLTRNLDRLLSNDVGGPAGPITGENFTSWSDRLREVEEMVEIPYLRNEVARARERARTVRQQYTLDRKKPDWAVVRLKIMQPLVEVQKHIAEELAKRESREALVPIDRDPVPNRYSDLVRRYYEELGKNQ